MKSISSKNRLVIVDDHVLISQALKNIIENFEQFQVLYDCENGEVLQQKFKIKSQIPDIVLLDVSMPVMDGFETASWLKAEHPNVLIMALSMQNDEQSVIKMISCGAHGYLLKNTNPSELERALNKLLNDGFYYPDWASKMVFSSLNSRNENKNTAVHLTEREKTFLSFAATELTYREIGEKMFCSPRTVESYRDSLFEKLSLKTRVGLAIYALKNGFAE